MARALLTGHKLPNYTVHNTVIHPLFIEDAKFLLTDL